MLSCEAKLTRTPPLSLATLPCILSSRLWCARLAHWRASRAFASTASGYDGPLLNGDPVVSMVQPFGKECPKAFLQTITFLVRTPWQSRR
jgi:hypothetical protein